LTKTNFTCRLLVCTFPQLLKNHGSSKVPWPWSNLLGALEKAVHELRSLARRCFDLQKAAWRHSPDIGDWRTPSPKDNGCLRPSPRASSVTIRSLRVMTAEYGANRINCGQCRRRPTGQRSSPLFHSTCSGTRTAQRIAEQLGHADTRMTEKHYAHLAPSYVADTIVASGDFNGNGATDVMWANPSTGSTATWMFTQLAQQDFLMVCYRKSRIGWRR
jgi:hypothetical protein